MTRILTQTNCPDLKLINQGKVRDIYDLGEHLLIVTSDRISAFDVIMDQGIPQKGYVLTQISKFWFEQMNDVIANHLVATEVDDFPAITHQYRNQLEGRSMLTKKAVPVPIECVVRGYLSGGGWKEYQQTGAVCGITLPPDMRESTELAKPIFTPSTKAELGTHDENISFEQATDICGSAMACKLRDTSIQIYQRARKYAASKGIIIADTKFEFGTVGDQLIWIDEAVTPDSSRFWPVDQYVVGQSQPSFDKQFLRDYLETLNWGKTAPAPELPAEIIQKTSEKYLEALKRLTA